MQQPRGDILRMLRAETAVRDLSPYASLIEMITEGLGEQVLPGLSAEECARGLLFEAALRPGPVTRNHAGELAYPLRAAKHLLALGVYPVDTLMEVPDTALSLMAIKNLYRARPVKGDDPLGPYSLGLRAQIAAVASHYGRSRGVLLKAGSPRLLETADTLLAEMRNLLAQPDLADVLRGRLAAVETADRQHRQERGDNSEATVEGDTSGLPRQSWQEIVPVIRRQLLRVAPHYPAKLTTLDLAPLLTLTPLSEFRPGASEGKYHASVASPPETVFEQMASLPQMALLGDPGAGKSTLLAAYVAWVADQDSSRILLFAPAALLAGAAASSEPRSPLAAATCAVAAFRGWLDVEMHQLLAEQLVQAIVDGEALVAIDGLDEEDDPVRAAELVRCIALLDTCELKLSSRLAGYVRPLPSIAELVVEPLTFSGLREFARVWAKALDDRRPSRFDKLLEDREIGRMASNPMTAGLIAAMSYDPEPLAPTRLYEGFLGHFFTRVWKPAAARRGDEVEVSRLVATAEEIAWTMVTSVRDGSPSQWETTVAARVVLQRVSDPAAARALLRTDGLLAMRGMPNPATPITEWRYSWLHRTLHEYLVGRHLFNVYGSDRQTASKYLREAALRLGAWEQPLRHFIGLLDDGGRAEVLWAMLKWARPVHGLADDVIDLFADVGVPRLGRNRIDRLIAKHDWTEALQVDPPYTLRRVHEVQTPYVYLRFIDDTRLWKVLQQVPPEALPTSDWLVEHLLDFNFGRQHNPMMSLLARRDPDMAIRTLLQWIDADPELDLIHSAIGDLVVEPETFDEVVARVLVDPLPTKRNALHLLRSLNGGYRRLRELASEDPAVIVAMGSPLWYGLNADISVPVETRIAALRGDHGPWVAAAVAESATAKDLQQGQTDPWALLSFEVTALIRRDMDSGCSDTWEELDWHEIESQMGTASIDRSQDPIILQRLIASIRAASARPDIDGLRALVDFCARLQTLSNASYWAHSSSDGSPRLGPGRLDSIVEDLAGVVSSQLEWSIVWPFVQSLLASKKVSDSPRGHLISHILDAQFHPASSTRRLGPSLEDREMALLEWGVSTNIPVIVYLRLGSPTVMTQALQLPDRYLLRGGNLHTLYWWAKREGVLPRWLPRLEHLTDAKETRRRKKLASRAQGGNATVEAPAPNAGPADHPTVLAAKLTARSVLRRLFRRGR